jgi:endonuclease YncB( thermonuclease family)
MFAATGAALILALVSQAAPVRVVDGDTLGLGGERVRLYGIDAPERGQTCERSGSPWQCGVAATAALAAWLDGKATTCIELDRDRYDRAVSTCSADGQDVGQWMVRQGWAVEYRQYSDGRYARDEREAAARRVGIHAGTFARPSEWRRGSASSEVAASYQQAGDCRIKGNINSEGERIYHAPGMRSYGPTRIDEARGERWFCSEQEARAAGWRAPLG